MPAAIPILVSLAGPVGLGILTATQTFFLVLGTSLLVNDYQRRMAASAARDAYNASLKDRLVSVMTTDRARSRVYGKVRNTDGILFRATHGVNSEYFTYVTALGAGEVDGIEDVYFGSDKLTLDANGYVLTAPYHITTKETVQEWFNIDSSGNGSFVLAHTPLAGSITIVADQGGDLGTVNIPFTVAGNTVTVTGAPVVGRSVPVSYQYDKGTSYARVRKYTGSSTQDISAELNALLPDMIVVGAHRFAGIALLLVTLQYNQDAFPQGSPPIATAVVRGTRVYDPRTGLTSWHAPNSPTSTPNPGENPALCALDWATYANGGNLTLAQTVLASFITAANDCDVSTTFNQATFTQQLMSPMESLSVTEARYKCASVIRTDANPDQALTDLVMSMAGNHGWSGGRLKVRAGAYHGSAITLTEDWVTEGSIEIAPGTATQDTVNILRPSIADDSQDFAVTPLPQIRAEAYIDADGVELPQDVQLGSVTSPYHAMDICEVMLLEARQALTVSLTCMFHAFRLELFDVVNVTLPHFGWTAKPFEVQGWSFTMTGGVRLTLREIAASTYDVATLFTLQDIGDNSSLPTPWLVEVPEGVTISSIAFLDNDAQVVTRTLVTWLPMASPAVVQNGSLEVQWASVGLAPVSVEWTNGLGDILPWTNAFSISQDWFSEGASALTDGDWNSHLEPGSSTSSTILGLRSGYGYLFRVRAVTKLQKGNWSLMRGLVIPVVAAASDSAALAAAQQAAQDAANQAALAQAAASAALAGVTDAIAAADAAAASATAATAAISSLSSDNILSAVEKLQVIQQYSVITTEQTGIDAQATAYGITTEKTAYDNAVSALTGYLSGLTSPTAWNDTAGDTTIVGTTFRANFTTVYTTRQALLNKIAEIAGQRAAWASISGIPYESIYTNDDSVALGFNPTFSAWSGSYPDGWQQWAGAAPTKETTLVRVGLYSVKWTASGSNLGAFAESTWVNSPMGVGTFVAGNIDIYLVSRTSGVPGVTIRLYTNAALSTFVTTQVPAPSTGVGSWQRASFTARVGSSERVYGIRMYLNASDTSFPAGGFTGTVVFDNLRLAFFDQSIDNTKITIAANGALAGAGGGQVTISGLGYTGDLNATYGANASNFTGHIGAGNLITYSAFRQDKDPPTGVAFGWDVYNNTSGLEPITPTRSLGAGMFGSDAQVLTWSVNNTSTKGLVKSGLLGGWEANQAYVISWYAKASGSNIGRTMENRWTGASPPTTTILNPALTSSYQRYAFRITWGSSGIEPNGNLFITILSNSLSQGSLTLSCVQVTKGDVLTEYMESVEDVRNAAAAAQASANDAAIDANTAQAAAASALASISDMTSDNVLSPVEKPALILDYQALVDEKTGIDAQATAYGITTEKTAYDNAYTTLTAYLGTLTAPVAWNNLTGSTTINGVTLRSDFANVYSTRQTLLNKISEIAGQRAAWLTVTGRPKSYRIVTCGYSANTALLPQGLLGLYDGDSLTPLGGLVRSYVVFKFSRLSGQLATTQTYDVSGNGATTSGRNAATMAADLNAIDSSWVVAVVSYDEPAANRLTSGLETAMYRCGASPGVFGSPQFRYRSAYILVGIGGCGIGNGAEVYQGQVDSDANAWVDISFMITAQGNLLVTGTTAIPRTLSDYSAGGLAYLNTVGTNQIDPGSATTVLESSDASTYNTNIESCGITFTPVVNCSLVLTAAGNWTWVSDAGSGYNACSPGMYPMLRRTSDNALIAGTGTYSGDFAWSTTASSNFGGQLTPSMVFSLTAGVTYTALNYSYSFIPGGVPGLLYRHATFSNLRLRAEIILR